MAQQPSFSGTPMASAVAVISPQYCTAFPVDLAVVKKVMTITDGNFVVTDTNGNILFKVKGVFLTLHQRRVLVDRAGNAIVTLREKAMTAHHRWQVFRGESTEPQDLLFSAKTSSMFNIRTKLDVFLANNTKQEVCDFKVKGSWLERSCTVYAGESSTIVAQMHKKHTVQSILIGKDNFAVTIYPNIDHAFIIALIVILDEINKARSSGSGGGGGSGDISAVFTG
ncbi:LURP-one-like protein [Melia azedarach]|uniref:LURP-one-like protein n=2 Tax=Melia azedarach TaxID=155640 RepID=A0ACC1WZW2_MELAZ|nr:LURP-one-like protein [Melia azedarach]KAJ4704308.1 LURP-one-like protein [Melia azedarach]